MSTKEELEVINLTNIDQEDYEGMFGGQIELIRAGETKPFPRFLAEHYAKHLTDKILMREQKDYSNESPFRKDLEDRILGRIVVPAAEQSPILAQPQATAPAEPIKEPEFTEAPKEELRQVGFKCEICGKVATSRIGLAGHSRSHKK